MVALAGIAPLYRAEGRDDEARSAATEALEIHFAGLPLRFENRIEPSAHLHPAIVSCCAVLAGLAADAGAPSRAARLLGHAARHQAVQAATLPPLLRRLLAQAEDAARAALGDEGFAEAHAQGTTDDLRTELAVPV
jgi:hypothetical protein